MNMINIIRLILCNCVVLGALRERRWHDRPEQSISSLWPCNRLLIHEWGTLDHLTQPLQWELDEGKWSEWDFLPSCKTFLSVRQPSRLTAGIVWLPTWSKQTFLQVLTFLAVSLSPNSLICHGYLAFHGYFLKTTEVCFAACMGLITSRSFE